MRRKLLATAFTIVAGIFATMSSPVQAVTTYEMYGFGTIEKDTGPGMPACVGHAGNAVGGNCPASGPTTVWKFASLTVNGHGMLQDKLVNGEYDCRGARSEISTVGHTGNFVLTWKFDCHRISGDGWENIVGIFTNANTAPGVFAFTGSFDGCDSHTHEPGANKCPGGADKVDMNCGAGFQPQPGGFTGTPPNGVVLTSVSFQGECTAAAP